MQPPIMFNKAAFTGQAALVWHSLQALATVPAAITLGSPGVNGAVVTQGTLGGDFPFSDPGSGLSYLAEVNLALGLNLGAFAIYDLLWYNTGLSVTVNTEQTLTSPTFPSRCVPTSGTTPDTNGGGLECWMIVTTTASSSTGIGATLKYTDQSGNMGATSQFIAAPTGNARAGAIYPFGLAAGDTGIRAIESFQLASVWASGAISLMVVRKICDIKILGAGNGPAAGNANTAGVFDYAALGMPQIYNGSSMYMAAQIATTTAAASCAGSIRYARG